MNEHEPNLRERLLALEPMNPSQKYQQAMQMLLEQKLTPPKKWAVAASLVVGIGFGLLFGTLAVMLPREVPGLARVGLILGALFGLAWAGGAWCLLKRGSINLRRHPPAVAALVWVFIVFMVTLDMLIGSQLPDRLTGLQMIVIGLVFLVGAAVLLISTRIEQAELRTREKLLELEYRLAEMAEVKGLTNPGNSLGKQ